MNVETRRMLEKRIARAFVKDMLRAGFSIAVFDGEEVCLKASLSMKEILAAMFSTDEDYLYVIDQVTLKRVGWGRFVYGEYGWDVLADYTVNLEQYMILTKIAQDNAERKYS
jgi:hypothetical protein